MQKDNSFMIINKVNKNNLINKTKNCHNTVVNNIYKHLLKIIIISSIIIKLIFLILLNINMFSF
jgi:hypothetical protein